MSTESWLRFALCFALTSITALIGLILYVSYNG